MTEIELETARHEIATGRVTDDPMASYLPPSELPIHTSVLLARPDVDCVVHAHPPAVHPRSVLLRSDELAAEMVASLGDAPAVILTGHGIVTTGRTVPEAVLCALHVDTLARLTLAVHNAGAHATAIPEADYVELPDLGSGFNEATLWRHHLDRAALRRPSPRLEQDGP